MKGGKTRRSATPTPAVDIGAWEEAKDAKEAGRLAELTREKTISETWKYFSEGDFETVSEYEAEKNQWAELGPAFNDRVSEMLEEIGY